MSSAGRFAPGRLWSLWDTMLQFDAGKLFSKIVGISNMGHSVGADLLLIPDSDLRNAKDNVAFVCEELERLELLTSLASASEIARILESEVRVGTPEDLQIQNQLPPLADVWALFDLRTIGRYQNYAADLVNRFKDEMSARVVACVEPRYAKYLAGGATFGDAVFNAFPSAREDIEESGKCLAFGRSTAAVFHLMRALESAAQAIAGKLGATVCDANGKGLPWGVIADNMKPKIDAMAKGSDEQIRWYRVQNDLVVVNRAWRVPTNHPKETYTLEQAGEVFDATKTFMRELSPLLV